MTKILWNMLFLGALTLTPSWAENILPTCDQMQSTHYRDREFITTKVESKQENQTKTLLVKFRVTMGPQKLISTAQAPQLPPHQKESGNIRPTLKDQKVIHTQPMIFSCRESFETSFQSREGIKRSQFERVVTFREMPTTPNPQGRGNPLGIQKGIRKSNGY